MYFFKKEKKMLCACKHPPKLNKVETSATRITCFYLDLRIKFI